MLRFQGGQYSVTDADRLWLSRAVEAEGPPRDRVARALVNGFAYARSKGKYSGSLMGWVRAYAQPVNSRWFTSGDLFKKHLAQAPAEERAELTRRAYTREAKHATRTEFTPETVAAVNEALSGVYASDVTDYAAATLDATHKGYVPRSVAKVGENRFWTRAVGWTGYRWVDGGSDGTSPAGGGGGAGSGGLVAVVLLAAAWALFRGRV